ncbi:hypothetical protein M404DRAFT_888865 [Pisolithus tinctorius Marx 270]|uniref:Uncharacterized protein n=1 Tax=Pisolithus tinctorius Marx 270 TaxID=870435 RepID=A0A0C3IL81_PISTI|nr:hypothetical protein M404DRAFT_888865 [Pisolithus tinctorius Marx 270]
MRPPRCAVTLKLPSLADKCAHDSVNVLSTSPLGSRVATPALTLAPGSWSFFESLLMSSFMRSSSGIFCFASPGICSTGWLPTKSCFVMMTSGYCTKLAGPFYLSVCRR